MSRVWNYEKRRLSNNIIVLILALVLNLFIFASQYQMFSNTNCDRFDFDCQIAEYTKLIEITPDNPINYYNRAVGYRGIGEYESAINDYSKAIELKPDLYEAYYNRSILLYDVGKTDEAIIDIVKVIEMNPEVANAHFFYGFIAFETQDYGKALNCFNKAIELDPTYKKAYQYRAKTFNKLGEKEKAHMDQEKLKDLNI